MDALNIIDKLPKASSGVDGISPILLKHIKNEICRPVTLILNQCFSLVEVLGSHVVKVPQWFLTDFIS